MDDWTKPLSFSGHFYISEDLRDNAKDPKVVHRRIQFVLQELQDDEDTIGRVRHLSEIGSSYRVLGELDQAEHYLEEALDLVNKEELGPKYLVTCGVKLAHVRQWQKRFDESNPMFEKLIEICLENRECEYLSDFVYQHHGKNLFDQQRYGDALHFFEQALKLREGKGDSDLLRSTEQAIRRTKESISDIERL